MSSRFAIYDTGGAPRILELAGRYILRSSNVDRPAPLQVAE
jgi:hypothetical protein